MSKPLVPLIVLSAFLACAATAEEEKGDSGKEQYTLAAGDPDYESMPDAPGKDEVYSFCSACHSMKLVSQQHLKRERWDKLLTWMVDEQGMAPLPDKERKLVLDYLAAHYGSGTEKETAGE